MSWRTGRGCRICYRCQSNHTRVSRCPCAYQHSLSPMPNRFYNGYCWQDTYIVPQSDGRIIIGATVEAGAYDNHVTPAGLMHILSYALQLVPALAHVPIEETWAGLRPVTPDRGPLLGVVKPWKNVVVAGGYWRNGILLAPRTGQLLATFICNDFNTEKMSERDVAYLNAFACDRFTSRDRATQTAAHTRYAANIHPLQQRPTTNAGSLTGMSSSSSTSSSSSELGSYDLAPSARAERQRDRDSMFGIFKPNKSRTTVTPSLDGSVSEKSNSNDLTDEDSDAAFERAALMGVEEAKAYDFGNFKTTPLNIPTTTNGSNAVLDKQVDDSSAAASFNATNVNVGEYGTELNTATMTSNEINDIANKVEEAKSDTAVSVANLSNDSDFSNGKFKSTNRDSTVILPSTTPPTDLAEVYQNIITNKAKNKASQRPSSSDDTYDDRPDPGFRIYHVDEVTGEHREIPPYTSPGEFFEQVKTEKSL